MPTQEEKEEEEEEEEEVVVAGLLTINKEKTHSEHTVWRSLTR